MALVRALGGEALFKLCHMIVDVFQLWVAPSDAVLSRAVLLDEPLDLCEVFEHACRHLQLGVEVEQWVEDA